MHSSSEFLKNAVAAAEETLRSLLHLDAQLAKAADLIEQCLRGGNKLLVCGNGGSAADASHFATEFVVRFMEDRPAYPAIALAGDGGLLTAAGNDYGFDEIFARLAAAYGKENDLLICLTTSGESTKVQRALEEARTRKLTTISLLGRAAGSSVVVRASSGRRGISASRAAALSDNPAEPVRLVRRAVRQTVLLLPWSSRRRPDQSMRGGRVAAKCKWLRG